MKTNIPVNDSLSLTAFEAGDKPNLLLYMNDQELYNNTLMVPSPYTEADADKWLDICSKELADHGHPINWAIRHQNAGVIGGIGSLLRTGLDGHRDEIGYWLAKPFRGQGLMTEVVGKYCLYLFESRPALHRIEAFTKTFNGASGKVLQKCGFQKEGYLHHYILKNGEFQDVIIYGRLRSWQ